MKKIFNIYTLVTLTLTLVFGIYLYSEYIFRKNTYIQEKINDLSLLYKTEILANKKISEALFDDILENEQVLSLIDQADKNINKDTNRDNLYNLFKDKYQRMSQKGILQFHFHLANGDSFLRFHKVDKFGDSILFRKSIRKVIETEEEVFGFEVGKYFDGFRYVYPLKYKNRYIGSVESSMKAQELVDQLRESTDSSYSLILKKELMDDLVDKIHLDKYYLPFCVNDNFYIDKNIHENMHNDKNTNKININIIKLKLHNEIANNKPFAKESTNENGDDILFVFVPIQDINKEMVGYIFSIEDNNRIDRMFYFQLLKFFIFFILLLILVQLYKKNKKLENEKLNNIQNKAIGKLSAGLSHEINTPLTIIKGNMEMMKGTLNCMEKSENKDYLIADIKEIDSNLKRIKNITETIREVADSNHFKIEKINLYSAIVTALRLTHNKAKKITKVKLQNDFFDLDLDQEHEQYFINADSRKLKQAFVAIINNSLDQLEHKGDFETNALNIKIIDNHENIKILFHDNGGGIDKDMLENIFKPFESNKKHKGLGIGLSVVKKIMDEHKFDITITNKDYGALVIITI